MSLDVAKFFNNLHYVGNSDCENLFKHASKRPEEREQIKNELKEILNDDGTIAKPKREKNAVTVLFRSIKINFKYAVNKSFRKKFDNAVKVLTDIKAEVIRERTAANAPQRVSVHAINHLDQQRQESEARRAELQTNLETVSGNLTQKQEQLDKLRSSFKKTSDELKAVEQDIETKTKELETISIRKQKLTNFQALLKEGSESSWPWTAQRDLRKRLREAYQEIKTDAYPTREFGGQFNQTKADELAKIIKEELEKVPARKYELIGDIGTLQESISAKNAAIAEARVHIQALEVEVKELTRQKESLEIQLNPQPTPTPAEEPNTLEETTVSASTQEPEPAVTETVKVVEEAPAVSNPKEEFITAIREKVGGAEGQKMGQMFEGLLNGAAITEFTYDPSSGYYTVKLTEAFRKWVHADSPKGGVILSIGDNNQKAFKFKLSSKKIEISDQHGLKSYGNLNRLPSIQDANLVKLEMINGGNKVKSRGETSWGGGDSTDNFNDMCRNWANGVVINKDEQYKDFWTKPNKYSWQARKTA